jgi:Divergent 4Fe-4S mono-cluster
VKHEGAPTERIIEQIKKCPSGALSYYMNRDAEGESVSVDAETIVEPAKDGPLLVYGNVTIKDSQGRNPMSQPFVAVERQTISLSAMVRIGR